MNEIYENTDSLLQIGGVWSWLIAVGIALLVTIIVKTSLHAVLIRLKKFTDHTESLWDDIVVDTLSGTKAWVIFVWLFVPFLPLLKAHESVVKAGRTVLVVTTGIQLIIWGFTAVAHWRKSFLTKRIADDASSVAAIGLLCTAIQFLVLVTVVLIGLSNLGVDVGALVAGLGVGGIAVALAAQNVLGDLLASLSIVLDKPFVVGDNIVVGSEAGTVENIGIKTTRVRSVSGEELVFSNKDLLESRIRNFKRMWQRRVVHKIGVTYSTSQSQLEQIPGWIKDYVSANPKLRFDRCHFCGFGSSSLDFELVFFVTDAEYNVYMDAQQKLLLDILRKFAQEKIEFAYPTQSILIEKVPAQMAMLERASDDSRQANLPS